MKELGLSPTTSNNKITITESEEQKEKEKMKKSEQSLRDLWDRSRGPTCVLRAPEETLREQAERLFEEIGAENFTDLIMDTNMKK